MKFKIFIIVVLLMIGSVYAACEEPSSNQTLSAGYHVWCEEDGIGNTAIYNISIGLQFVPNTYLNCNNSFLYNLPNMTTNYMGYRYAFNNITLINCHWNAFNYSLRTLWHQTGGAGSYIINSSFINGSFRVEDISNMNFINVNTYHVLPYYPFHLIRGNNLSLDGITSGGSSIGLFIDGLQNSSFSRFLINGSYTGIRLDDESGISPDYNNFTNGIIDNYYIGSDNYDLVTDCVTITDGSHTYWDNITIMNCKHTSWYISAQDGTLGANYNVLNNSYISDVNTPYNRGFGIDGEQDMASFNIIENSIFENLNVRAQFNGNNNTLRNVLINHMSDSLADNTTNEGGGINFDSYFGGAVCSGNHLINVTINDTAYCPLEMNINVTDLRIDNLSISNNNENDSIDIYSFIYGSGSTTQNNSFYINGVTTDDGDLKIKERSTTGAATHYTINNTAIKIVHIRYDGGNFTYNGTNNKDMIVKNNSIEVFGIAAPYNDVSIDGSIEYYNLTTLSISLNDTSVIIIDDFETTTTTTTTTTAATTTTEAIYSQEEISSGVNRAFVLAVVFPLIAIIIFVIAAFVTDSSMIAGAAALIGYIALFLIMRVLIYFDSVITAGLI